MLVFIISALIWIALTTLIIAVCKVADCGDRALVNVPGEATASSRECLRKTAELR